MSPDYPFENEVHESWARDRETLHGFIREHTDPETQEIHTDEWTAYGGLEDEDTAHLTIKHSDEEWVNGKVYTNTVESIWSLLKRSIIGSYHKMSIKHLERYLDELGFRHNNRGNPFMFRDALRRMLASENLEYKKLIA